MDPPEQPGITRKASSLHYQTFPTKPPSGRGKPPPLSPQPTSQSNPDSPNRPRSSSSGHHVSPLPIRQLAVLAVIALSEQTALNSIAPYLPDMVSTFPEVDETRVGIYVGLVASSFALAQFATNFFWGYLSDRIGRKPVVLMGTLLTAACFVAFGFTRTLWQAIVIQACMGLVNGNQGVVSTCLGEITDRSNQSKAFTYLPVIYGIGGITGPIVGGLLVSKRGGTTALGYPYLAPNLLSAGVLMVDLVVTMIFMQESLEELKNIPPLGTRMRNAFARLWEFSSGSRRPRMTSVESYTSTTSRGSVHYHPATASDSGSEIDFLPVLDTGKLKLADVLNRDTSLILGTFLIFQLCNIAYNSLYPIFAQAAQPTGRNLSPENIGLSLAFAGLVTIVFQVGIFGRLRDKIGNKTTYRIGLGGFVVAFLLMPWVGYKNSNGGVLSSGKGWLWFELGVVLIIKTVAAVGGLTSALLLITNSARDHSVLGTLNGLAQTLSAGGRAVGPFVSGGLFSLAIKVRPKGEALAFGVFGGVAFIGFVLSFFIRSEKLEDQMDEEEDGDSVKSKDGDVNEDDDDDERTQVDERDERTSLLHGRR